MLSSWQSVGVVVVVGDAVEVDVRGSVVVVGDGVEVVVGSPSLSVERVGGIVGDADEEVPEQMPAVHPVLFLGVDTPESR